VVPSQKLHPAMPMQNTQQGYRREGRGELGNQEMGIKEGMCCDKHWVLYATNESLSTASKTNDVLLYAG